MLSSKICCTHHETLQQLYRMVKYSIQQIRMQRVLNHYHPRSMGTYKCYISLCHEKEWIVCSILYPLFIVTLAIGDILSFYCLALLHCWCWCTDYQMFPHTSISPAEHTMMVMDDGKISLYRDKWEAGDLICNRVWMFYSNKNLWYSTLWGTLCYMMYVDVYYSALQEFALLFVILLFHKKNYCTEVYDGKLLVCLFCGFTDCVPHWVCESAYDGTCQTTVYMPCSTNVYE